jgi:hypothetical protein
MKHTCPPTELEDGTRIHRKLLFFFLPLVTWLPQGALSAIVLNQIGPLSPFDSSQLPPPGPSQIFTDFPASSCAVIEDFSVTADALRVTQVSALMRAQGGFQRFEDVLAYRLDIFSDANLAGSNLAGDVGSVLIPAGAGASVTQIIDASGNHEFGLVVLNVDVPLRLAGIYWVGVSPVAANSVAGQFFLQTSKTDTSGTANARLANPGLGLGAGALSILDSHFAYAVTAEEAIPEPGVLALAFLGAGCWLFQRTRRSPSPTLN